MPMVCVRTQLRAALAAAALLAANAHSHSVNGRAGHGLIGYGIDMYDPLCASSCQAAAPMRLFCSDAESFEEDMDGMSMMAMDDSIPTDNVTSADGSGANATMTPSPACMANGTAWLQTVAYCISTHCDKAVSMPQREAYWSTFLLGRDPHQPMPSMSYQQALASLSPGMPNATLTTADEPLESAVLIDEASYTANYNSMGNFQHAEALHSRYALVLLITCFAVPIALSLLRFVRIPVVGAGLARLVQIHFIDAPLVSSDNPKVLFGLLDTSGTSRGQAFFMLYIVAVNVILCAVGYASATPGAWFGSSAEEIVTLISNRTGVLSFANVPLLILFAGRNNVLLWLTDWSRSTFLKLHRCVAVLCTVQACLHSAIYLQLKLAAGRATYEEEAREPYWIMGIVATLALSLLLPLSLAQLRKRAYEVFLLVHIALAVLVVVGCWYHIAWRFGHQWGYETYLYMAIAVWVFERLARFVRVLATGVKTATVYRIDEDYLCLQIDNVKPGYGHLYAYFPTLPSQFPWQNHPFSALPFAVSASVFDDADDDAGEKNDGVPTGTAGKDHHKIVPHMLSHEGSPSVVELSKDDGLKRRNPVTLLLRVQRGTTEALSTYVNSLFGADAAPTVSCLLEPGYDVRLDGHTDGLLTDVRRHRDAYPNILCLVGGVGITAVLPMLLATSRSGATPTAAGGSASTKLFWGARSPALVRTVRRIMAEQSSAADAGSVPWPTPADKLEATFALDERMDMHAILAANLTPHVGTQVVLSGPPSMMFDARRFVVQLVKQGAVKARIVEESFVF